MSSAISFPVLSSSAFLSDDELTNTTKRLLTKDELKTLVINIFESTSATHVDIDQYYAGVQDREVGGMLELHNTTKEAKGALYKMYSDRIDKMKGDEGVFHNYNFYIGLIKGNVDRTLITKKVWRIEHGQPYFTAGSISELKNITDVKVSGDSLWQWVTEGKPKFDTGMVTSTLLMISTDAYSQQDPIQTLVHETSHALTHDYYGNTVDYGGTLGWQSQFRMPQYIYLKKGFPELLDWIDKNYKLGKMDRSFSYIKSAGYPNHQIMDEFISRARGVAATTSNPSLEVIAPGYQDIFYKDFAQFLEDIVIPPSLKPNNPECPNTSFLESEMVDYIAGNNWGIWDATAKMRYNTNGQV